MENIALPPGSNIIVTPIQQPRRLGKPPGDQIVGDAMTVTPITHPRTLDRKPRTVESKKSKGGGSGMTMAAPSALSTASTSSTPAQQSVLQQSSPPAPPPIDPLVMVMKHRYRNWLQRRDEDFTRKVLLVDDDTFSRFTIRLKLLRAVPGLTPQDIEEVEDGAAAVMRIRPKEQTAPSPIRQPMSLNNPQPQEYEEMAAPAGEQGARYRLVVMDYHMPIMCGDEAVRCMRAHGYQGPIVGLSGDVETSVSGNGCWADCAFAKSMECTTFLDLAAAMVPGSIAQGQ